MITGKQMGLKKGDFVFTGAFPGIIISDVHTFAPCCEVWGIEHELGSAYAADMRKLTREEFLQQCADMGYSAEKLDPIAAVSIEALNKQEAATMA